MELKQIIDVVLESHGGLNLYAPEVRNNVIDGIFQRMCWEETYKGILGKDICEEEEKKYDEMQERLNKEREVVEDTQKEISVEPIIEEKQEEIPVNEKKKFTIKRNKNRSKVKNDKRHTNPSRNVTRRYNRKG